MFWLVAPAAVVDEVTAMWTEELLRKSAVAPAMEEEILPTMEGFR